MRTTQTDPAVARALRLSANPPRIARDGSAYIVEVYFCSSDEYEECDRFDNESEVVASMPGHFRQHADIVAAQADICNATHRGTSVEAQAMSYGRDG